jgi:hypothetical protein
MPYQKGQSGNPGGRPASIPVPEDVLQAKIELRADFDRLICQMLRLPIPELEASAADLHKAALERILANCISKILKGGNLHTLESLLDRTLGKPVDALEMEVRDTAILARRMMELPIDEKIKMLEEKLAEMKEKKDAKDVSS